MCINKYKTIDHDGYFIFKVLTSAVTDMLLVLHLITCIINVQQEDNQCIIELNYFECPRVIREIWHFILIPGFHTNNIATNCKFLSYTHTRNIRNTRASNHAHSNTLFMSKINGWRHFAKVHTNVMKLYLSETYEYQFIQDVF